MNDGTEIFFGCLGVIALIVILIAVGALLIVLVWGWVVPDVFSGAVAQNMLPASLTFWQSIKLMILFSILGLTGQARSSSKK